jgi:predicted metal-dependent hydrolase
MTEPPYDPHFLEGIEFFNRCEFFEAHEAWEELWQDYSGPARKFYQGLIQVAVCLHHFGNGNTRGAVKLYHSSRAYLEPYAPQYHGINVDGLLGDLARCCEQMLADPAQRPPVEIDPELIPEIHLG